MKKYRRSKLIFDRYRHSIRSLKEHQDFIDVSRIRNKKIFTESRELIDEIDEMNFVKPIKIGDLENYLKSTINTDELKEQFESLPQNLTKPCECGALDVNKPKNRFNNILAYDHTRVKLHQSSRKEGNDYINANYIKGLKKDRMYIATQGPRALTINHFWEMIWQENSRYIILLSNFEENGVKRFEKYWPNDNQDFQFGSVHVYFHSSELYADYQIRTFKLICEGCERKVLQYHFLRWPDQGVPTYFLTLLPFIKKTSEINSKAPIVVQCCSGTGATGVFLLCDILLKLALRLGIVDFYKISYELREQRVNMIQNLMQYKLAHLIVFECFYGVQAILSCNEDIDSSSIKLTGPEELRFQMNYLKGMEWQNDFLLEKLKTIKIISNKNKNPEIIPDETNDVVQLPEYPIGNDSSSYINAIRVDGYGYPNRYIITQQPMPNTLADFWRMIVSNDVQLIISLNEINSKDKKSCDIWPTEDHPETSPVDFMIIKYISSDEDEYSKIIIVQINVNGKESKSMPVKIISMKYWESKKSLPNDLEGFLKFFSFSETISRQYRQSVITCYDGNLACGIYVVTSYLIEKIKLEKKFDVCEAVRITRKNRKQFITDKVQLLFLYEIATTYIKGFQNYANFSTSPEETINIYDYIE